MRLHFPQGQHPDALWAEGRLSLGSGETCRVRIDGLAENHVWIDVDMVRGLELHVAPGAEVHVNGRPVREKAILRLGDELLLNTVPMRLKSDSDQRESPPKQVDFSHGAGLKNLSARATLRAVSGDLYGKVIGLKTRTTIGRGPENDLVINDPGIERSHAVVESATTGVYLRSVTSNTDNGVSVNGVMVRDSVLKPGDQISFQSHRFVLETIGATAIEAMFPTPPITQVPTTTQVGMRPITPPPVPAAAPTNAPAAQTPATQDDVPARTNVIANTLMLLASAAAIAGLIWGIWRR
jgi:hypothetical protein